jgi:hypothetical protein
MIGTTKRAASRQRRALLTRRGLLDQVDARGFEHGDAARGIGLVPGLVDIHGHAGTVTKRALDRRYVRHVVAHAAPADLELERVVAALGQQALGFVDVLRGIAAGQRPQHRQCGAHRATEQRNERHADALALRIEQRGFQRRLRKAVAARDLVQPRHRGVDVCGVLAGQRRGQVRVDGQLDAFGALIAVRQAADGGGFANPFDAVAAAQPHDHQRLLLHGGHGQLMGPDGGQVDQDGLDGRDRRFHTFSIQ